MFWRRIAQDWTIPAERECWLTISRLDAIRRDPRFPHFIRADADEVMFLLEGATRDAFGRH